MLTTHYHKVCDVHNIDPSILNKQMFCIMNDDKIIYKYKLADGISSINGGLNVLYDLKYPDEIIHRFETQ